MILFTVFAAAICPILLASQEMKVPMDLQVQLLMKILSFDRNLKTRVGTELVIGIIYQSKFSFSYNAKEEFLASVNRLPQKEIESIPIRVVPINIEDETKIDGAILNNDVDILYLTPLSTVDVNKISEICQAKKILTIAGIPDYVESGIAVSLGIKGTKPKIIINLPAAQAEGSDFSSRLLNLADVKK